MTFHGVVLDVFWDLHVCSSSVISTVCSVLRNCQRAKCPGSPVYPFGPSKFSIWQDWQQHHEILVRHWRGMDENFFVSRWRRKHRCKCAHRKKKARMWSKLACQLHQCFLDISSNQQYTLFQMVAYRDFWQMLLKFRSYKRFFLKACRDYKWGWLKVLRDYSIQSSLWEMQIANVGQLAFTVNGIRFV